MKKAKRYNMHIHDLPILFKSYNTDKSEGGKTTPELLSKVLTYRFAIDALLARNKSKYINANQYSLSNLHKTYFFSSNSGFGDVEATL